MKRKILKFPVKKEKRKFFARKPRLSAMELKENIAWNGAMLNLLERALRFTGKNSEAMLRELNNALEVNRRRVEEHRLHAGKGFRDTISPKLGKIIADLVQSISKSEKTDIAVRELENLIESITQDNKKMQEMKRLAA